MTNPSVIRAYKKTSEEFVVTYGVHQGCVLAPTLSNLFIDAMIRMAIDDHLEEGRGCELYSMYPHATLIGDRRKIMLMLETLVSGLEYAGDMVLLSSA